MAVFRSLARTGGVVGGALWLLAAVAPAAGAHPLGNFSISHYTGLTLHTDRIEALAVTDTAEIPTLQEQTRVDRDGNGTVDDGERAAWAEGQCAQTAQRLRVTTGGGHGVAWTVRSHGFQYRDGAAGLRTSRLECGLEAPLQLAGSGTSLRVATGVDPTRVGWNEITARGEGVRLDRSDVPTESVSHQLNDYPRDLLDNPRGVTTAELLASPGAGSSSASGTVLGISTSGPSSWIAALNGKVVELGGARRLTVPVGILAVLLSIVLGAGHALLPGHGKAVMAAYLAGRRGRTRDAVTVGATVTATHTAGVLVMGLCLTAFSSLAGDVVLGRLGAVSGALVALVGAGLLVGAVRRLRAGRAGTEPEQRATVAEPERELVHAGAAGGSVSHHLPETGEHPHPHPHSHDHDHDHGHGHRHGLFGGAHHHHHPEPDRPIGRGGLIGLGIAGGLVPSPSALVVLLGAVALGRTLFGATLVLAYGLGMAATLTAVGLLIVKLGDRFAAAADGPLVRRVRRIAPYTAALTALLVLAVGAGLLIRSLPSTL